MTTIATAAREYAARPPDERYSSLEELVSAAQHDRQSSREVSYNLRDLRAVAVPSVPNTDEQRDRLLAEAAGLIPQRFDADDDRRLIDYVNDRTVGTVQLESPKGRAGFSHWSFSQLSRMVGAPAAYLRELPADLAAECLNHGIRNAPVGTVASLLVQAPNGRPDPTIRACTSDSYGRVWDAEIYSAIHQTIVARDDRWTLPPTWSGESAGAYRGDRDSFLILVNGGSIVTDPSIRNSVEQSTRNVGHGPENGMFRGLLIRNSEVGASSLLIESILYRYICGNHMLWGALMDRQFRRRHVGTRVVRDAIREIHTFARSYVQQSTERDNAIIRGLIDRELAHTREAVIDELKAIGCTKEQAEQAYARCEQTESVSPRSYWGAAQGLTRLSQESPYQDGRFLLDQLASKVLSRGARLVAA